MGPLFGAQNQPFAFEVVAAIAVELAGGAVQRQRLPIGLQATNMPSSMHQVTPSRVEQFGWP